MNDQTATRNVQLVQPASGAVDREAGFARSLAVIIGIDGYSQCDLRPNSLCFQPNHRRRP